MRVQLATGVEIEYDAAGDPKDPALLLIWGLAGQGMVLYTDEFRDRLVAHGYYVIRMDNRDIGLSSQMTRYGQPNCMPVKMCCSLTCGRIGLFPSCVMGRANSCCLRGGYTLSDMAFDVVGLLDALHIEQVNVVAQSMGGMMAQELLINFSERVRGLVMLMSSGGFPLPHHSIMANMNRGPPKNATYDQIMEYVVVVVAVVVLS